MGISEVEIRGGWMDGGRARYRGMSSSPSLLQNIHCLWNINSHNIIIRTVILFTIIY